MRHTLTKMVWRSYAGWWPQLARSFGSGAEHAWQEEMRPSPESQLTAPEPMMSEREGELLVMFKSYADASGTDDRQPYTSFAGYIAGESDWCKFSKEWLEVLADLKLGAEFRASKFYARTKRENWFQQRVDDCIVELAKVIKRWTKGGFGVLLNNEEFNCILSPIAQRRMEHRYYLLFAEVLHKIRRFIMFKPHDTIELFFDNDPGHEGKAARIFEGFKKQYDRQNQFVTRAFVSSICFPPIQAADFIAYELRLYGRGGGHRNENVRTAMTALKGDLRVSEVTRSRLEKLNKQYGNT
jgi:hypothetical protein